MQQGVKQNLVRRYHYLSGLILALFIGVHIFNHLLVLVSEDVHIAFMNMARKVYRNPVVETILLMVVMVQAVTGIILVIKKRKHIISSFDRLHVYSGLYLSYFMIVHVAAVLYGRFVLQLDTNLYFGAGVMASFPAMLVYIPYYALALLSFFIHVACIHRIKMEKYSSAVVAQKQSRAIIAAGIIITVLVVTKMATLTLPAGFAK